MGVDISLKTRSSPHLDIKTYMKNTMICETLKILSGILVAFLIFSLIQQHSQGASKAASLARKFANKNP